MTRQLPLNLAISILLTFTGCGEPLAVVTPQRVVLARASVDSGTMPPTNRVFAAWELINNTEQAVNVEQLTLSCSCMETDFEKGFLPAGGRKEFRTWVDDPTDGLSVRFGRLVVAGQTEPVKFEWRY